MFYGINRISGPISWSYYKLPNKNLHIFGDYHTLENLCSECYNPNCISIQDLLKYISYRSVSENKYIDIYLETGYALGYIDLTVSPDSATYPLQNVAAEFAICTQKEKEICQYYSYVRFHYADVRYTKSLEKGLERTGLLTLHS